MALLGLGSQGSAAGREVDPADVAHSLSAYALHSVYVDGRRSCKAGPVNGAPYPLDLSLVLQANKQFMEFFPVQHTHPL